MAALFADVRALAIRSTCRLLRVFVLAVFAPSITTAQSPTQTAESTSVVKASPPATSWPSAPTCTIAPDAAPLRRTLPLDVLARLEDLSNSAFVQAYLIQFVADSSAGNHRVSRCARAFLSTSLTDVAGLRQTYPDVAGIISALRTAENARIASAQLEDTKTISGLLERLQTDPSSANLEALGKILAAVKCGAATPCDVRARAVARMDSVRAARQVADASTAQATQAAQALATAESQLSVMRADASSDSLQLDRLKQTVDSVQQRPIGSPKDTTKSVADISILDALQQRVNGWAPRIQLAAALDSSLTVAADSAHRRQEAATKTAVDLLDSLRNDIDILKHAVERAAPFRDALAIANIPHLDGRLRDPIAPSPAPLNEQVRSTAPASIVVELTDFIISRAESEAVNSFIVNLHNLAEREPLLEVGFPSTWHLMRGLPHRDHQLDALAVGRVPLTVWRATLASDFATLPTNLLQAGPVGLCGSAAKVRDTAVQRQALTTIHSCQERAAEILPLAPFATRLLQGDGVFDVLGDAQSFVAVADPQLPPQWRRIVEGAAVLGSLAQTYSVQGYAPAVDPARYPYILTSHALAQTSTMQRDAYLRLLVVRAINAPEDVPAAIDPARLFGAVTNGAQLLDRVAARLAAPDTGRTATAAIVQASFDALVDATGVASALAANSRSRSWIDSTRSRWREVSDVYQPLAARDFGLALSRVVVLLRDVRSTDVPPAVITFAALASTLSEVQSGDAMQRAFEYAASPAGGWQAKRYGEGGVSINAFPGVTGGGEMLIRQSPSDPKSTADIKPTVGVTLPIGIEWLRSDSHVADTQARRCLLCNAGIFVPILDLGAVLSYRIGPSRGVDPTANATLRQVFAPGFYGDFVLTRTVPLNLLVGAQIMPSLRRLTGGSEELNRTAVRFGAELTMDVQLLKF